MAYTAVGVFQTNDENVIVSVKVGGFASRRAAERYANIFRVKLSDGRLLHSEDGGSWFEIYDFAISLSQLKPAARERIERAHRRYRSQGLDQVQIMLESIDEFERRGESDLVVSESDDYEPADISILRDATDCEFGPIAYSVEPDRERPI